MLQDTKFMKRLRIQTIIFELLFKLCMIIAGTILFVIIFFILSEGIPVLREYGFTSMLLENVWAPTANPSRYGLLAMILTTLISTLLAMIIAIPLGVLTSLYLSKLAPAKVKKTIMFFVELMAGIPSVIIGFFILRTVVFFIQEMFMHSPGISGFSLAAVIIVLVMMSLPIIITITVTSLDAVDKSYAEASLALGASKIQTIFKVDLRAARSGIMAAIVLGAGRAIGETMAVMLVAGNHPNMPFNIFMPVRTLTANIAMEMGYATGTHRSALFATGIFLLIFIMILNFILLRIIKKGDINNVK